MNFTYASRLATWWSMSPRRAYGEITSAGTRKPNPCASTSGGTTWS